MLLNQKLTGIGLYRTIFYLPSLVPAVAATLLWLVILDPRLGLVNEALGQLGIAPIGWFQSAEWAKPSLILISLWQGSGGAMLIFLAALKEIPQSLMDAAMIDGAGALQRFRHVTLPLISPTILFNLILGIIGSFQVFGTAFVATGSANTAGPLNSLLMYMLPALPQCFPLFQHGLRLSHGAGHVPGAGAGYGGNHPFLQRTGFIMKLLVGSKESLDEFCSSHPSCFS